MKDAPPIAKQITDVRREKHFTFSPEEIAESAKAPSFWADTVAKLNWPYGYVAAKWTDRRLFSPKAGAGK